MSNENEARVPAGSPEGGQWTTYVFETERAGVQHGKSNEGVAAAEKEMRSHYQYDIGTAKVVNQWPVEQQGGDTSKPISHAGEVRKYQQLHRR